MKSTLKKVLLIISAIILVIGLSSCQSNDTGTTSTKEAQTKKAEPFTLRNGIKFGMTANEIKELEKSSGYEFEETDKRNNYFKSGTYRLVCDNIEVAGREGSDVAYLFDNNKMTSCVYYASDIWREPFNNDSIISTLKQKYGEPIATGEKYIDIGKAFDALDNYSVFYSEQNGQGGYCHLNDYYQWIVETEGGYVDIMFLMFDWRGGGNTYNYRFISYTFRTQEEWVAVQDEIQHKKDSMNSDL